MNRVGTFCLSSDCQLPLITSYPFLGAATECCLHSCSLTETRRVTHVEHELLTLPEYLSSAPVFSGTHVGHPCIFWVMFCRSLFVLLSFFDVWLLITPLVSSNFSNIQGAWQDADHLHPVVKINLYFICSSQPVGVPFWTGCAPHHRNYDVFQQRILLQMKNDLDLINFNRSLDILRIQIWFTALL